MHIFMDTIIQVLKSGEERSGGQRKKKIHSQHCLGSWFLLVSPYFEWAIHLLKADGEITWTNDAW
jgi:hypothetical protein